jgi:hypothetical protein
VVGLLGGWELADESVVVVLEAGGSVVTVGVVAGVVAGAVEGVGEGSVRGGGTFLGFVCPAPWP